MKPKSETVVPDRISVSRDRAEKQRAEEQARIEGKAQADAEAKNVAERTARLKAARLARKAADKAAADSPVAPAENFDRANRTEAGSIPRKGKRK